MTMDPRKLKKFCDLYGISILNDQRFKTYRKPDFFTDPKDAAIMQSGTVPGSDKIYVLEISERDLLALMSVDRAFFQTNEDHGEHKYFSLMTEWLDEQAKLRATSPAVQDAWEQYSTLLHLCRPAP